MMIRVLTIWLALITAASAQSEGAGNPDPATGPRPRPVVVRPLSELLSPVLFTAPAEVLSTNRARLSARIEAQIEDIPVDVGDNVTRGQVVVNLDCTDHELARRRAEAELLSARTQSRRAAQQLARSEALARDTLLSQDLLEQRQTERDAAQAEERRSRIALQQAEVAVSRCRVKSPLDGVVTGRLAARGELARPGTALLEIVDLESIEVAAQVFPSEQPDLDASPHVFFRFLEENYPLRVVRRVSVIDPVTRNMEIRLVFENRRAPVGASGRLVWHGRNPGVPAGMMVQRDSRLGIFLARNGRAVFHPLPRAQEGRPAMVDLPLDTLVVTEGRQSLRDGDVLDIAE
jgi:RND family efflux transporter MFP subunit